nr:hypothetical protein [Tanacetum cinerariifolium]
MSDFVDSTVTYTTRIHTHAFQSLPSPDYVLGLEEPEQAPPSPVYIPYVPEPEYPEYIPQEDKVFPAEEQPLPAAASPTTDSPGYIPESDPDEDPEEDPADYPADHDDDEEEEHPALADSIPPPPTLRVTARISFRPQPPTLSFTKEDAERFLAMPIPPSLPVTPLSSPIPQIPSSPLPASPPILPIPLPAASLPLQLLSSDHRADRTEVTLPPRKRLSIVHYPGYEAGESLVAAAARPIEGRRANYGFVDFVKAEIRRRRAEDIGYGIKDTWIDPRDVAEEDQRIDAQDTLIATLTTQLSSLQGHLATALGEIRVLQAREQARAGASEGAASMIVGFVFSFLVSKIMRTERVTRECTYQDFMKCQPLYFKSTEGVVKLTQWFERMETVFCISNCLAENQVKFATCTLRASALTWWNSHVRIVGNDAAYVMTWIELKKKMADKYCPRNEMKKIETKVERYIGGLPDSIHGSVAASKPKTMQEATEMATGLMDYAERQAANKRKFEDTSRNNQGRQQPPKRKDVVRAYAAGSGNRQQSPTNANVANNQRGNEADQKATCYECGAQGHFKRNCPKLKNNNNNNRGNQVRTRNA